MADALLGVVSGIRPVFVSSLYRSTSTFLAGLIGCHPEYCATSSLVKFLRFCLYRYDPVDQPAKYRRLVHETCMRIKTRWNVEFDVEAAIAHAERVGVSYAVLYDAIMREVLRANGGGEAQWLEKIAVMWSRIPEFLTMFPEGRVIHIVRDPRSVAASYKKMTSEPGYTYLDAAFNTVHAIQSVRRYQKKFGGRVMLLRAEDLTRNPRLILGRICDFLGMPFSDRMLQPDVYSRVIGEDWRGNTSFSDTLSGFMPPAERWREHMTAAEIAFVELICQPYLTPLGYKAEGQMPSRKEWNEIYDMLEDPFLEARFTRWLGVGEGTEGYRTDPYLTEMKIVFPERFGGRAGGAPVAGETPN